MTEFNNLHRKIRHYCIDGSKEWTSIYYQSGKNKHLVLADFYRALLNGVEEIEPEKFISISELKKQIIESALISQSEFTKEISENLKPAVKEEGKIFKEFVEKVSKQDLLEVPDLFYRRRLRKTEADYWINKLELNSIEFSGYWFPKGLEEITKNEKEFLVFDEDVILEEQEQIINEIIKPFVNDKYFVFLW
jgi:hypothetical protein